MWKASTAASENGSAERSAERARGPGAFVRRHGLVSYYAMAYGLSWLVWLPYVLSQYGLGVVRIPYPMILGSEQFTTTLPGAYLGPLGAAFIVTAISEGRPGLRRWTGRLFKLGVGWKWYAVAFFGVPAVVMLGTLPLPGVAGNLSFPALQAFLIYVPFLLIQAVTTGLAEEPGWRDFALVRHQRLQGPLFGTLILGVLWAGWHFPLFLTNWGELMGGPTLRALLTFTADCVVFSLFVTWLFNRTRESLPLAILAHVSSNNFGSVMLVSMLPLSVVARTGLLGDVIGFSVVALVLVVLTRGRLGYKPETHADGPDGPHEGRGRRADGPGQKTGVEDAEEGRGRDVRERPRPR